MTTITLSVPQETTTANGYPTHDELMEAIQHISDVLGTDEMIPGEYRYEWTEIWDTVHRILDPAFKERWVEVTGDNP